MITKHNYEIYVFTFLVQEGRITLSLYTTCIILHKCIVNSSFQFELVVVWIYVQCPPKFAIEGRGFVHVFCSM